MKKELEARTKRFALSTIELVGKLPRGKVSDVIGYQLLKSGTPIGANYREANRAQTHDDFIHKIAICEKEAAETEYWLELAQEANDHTDFKRRVVARSSRIARDICSERPNSQITSLNALRNSTSQQFRNPHFAFRNF